jgi:hypothetical protein
MANEASMEAPSVSWAAAFALPSERMPIRMTASLPTFEAWMGMPTS